MIDLFGITWAAPGYSCVFLILVGAIMVLIYRTNRLHAAMKIIAGAWSTLLIRHFSPTKQILKTVFMGIGLLFLLLALLRPQWHKKEETVAQHGRDLFVALDVSRSMVATDCQPDRLTCAKEKIKRLLTQLKCERVGLILFSGSAFVQCPLTSDFSAFHLFLDQVDVETISSGTTALDQALKQALQAFEQMKDKKNKLLVMFTDGEDFSRNLHEYKQRAQAENLHVFTVGVGTTQGAPIPLFDAHGKQVGHQKDAKGNVVISHLNEGTLHTLARDAGGTYIRLTQDDSDVHKLVRQIQAFKKERIEDKTFNRLEDQYPYFLLVSFICFAFEWLL